MNEALKKIDAEIICIKKVLVSGTFTEEIYGTLMGKLQMAERIKEIILSEQKEPCGWCSKWRLEFNAIDDEGNTITTDGHMVMGGIADYCPMCGRYLNQPQEGE